LVLKSLLINYDLLDLVLVFNEGDKYTCEELRNEIAIRYSPCSSAEFYAYQYILLAILLDKVIDVLDRNRVVKILETMITQYTGDISDSLLAALSE
jgi:hypothetical protein